MKLKRNSLWIRWAYLPEIITKGQDIPNRSDLCSIFWRGVLLTPAFLFVCLLISPALVLAYLITKLAELLEDKPFISKLGKVMNTPIEDTVPVQWLKAKKQGICPLVEIVD